ncbi:MAG: VOC family protein [Dehalococcoidales bacterium]|nr:VOC family protein [Dehalococcoidales bacterium]
MKVDRLCHVHFWVNDLRKACSRYSEILEDKWVGPIDWDPLKLVVAFDNIGIELFEPKTLDSPSAKYRPASGEGFACLGLKVHNIDEAVADLKSKGMRFLEALPGQYILQANESLRAAWTLPEDLFGVMLELLEYEDRTPISLANLNRLSHIPEVPTTKVPIEGGKTH